MPIKDKKKQAAASRKWYLKNKEKVLQANNKRRQKLRQWLCEYKEERPCTDCQTFYPYYVMEFDHITGTSDKLTNISELLRRWGKAKLEAELLKCEPVCANCHRIRTFGSDGDKKETSGTGADQRS